MSKNTSKGYFGLLLIGEEGKSHYVLIKDVNTSMYDHTLHRGRKHICLYCLQAFSTAKILKSHVNDLFNINGKQMVKMPKKGEYVRFKFYERKIKSPFMIYVDFKSILVPEHNGKQNLDEQTYVKNMLFEVMAIN